MVCLPLRRISLADTVCTFWLRVISESAEPLRVFDKGSKIMIPMSGLARMSCGDGSLPCSFRNAASNCLSSCLSELIVFERVTQPSERVGR